jgi:hypothetical protein
MMHGQNHNLNFFYTEIFLLSRFSPQSLFLVWLIGEHESYNAGLQNNVYLIASLYPSVCLPCYWRTAERKLDTERNFIKLDTERIFIKLNTEQIFIKFDTEWIFIKLNTERIFIKLDTKRNFIKLNTERNFIKFDTERIFIKLDTGWFY